MRYILFGGDEIYYAKGGGHDFVKSSNNIDELKSIATKGMEDRFSDGGLIWWHIFDVSEGIIITGSQKQPFGASDLAV